jgi:hypothetical protein
MTHLGMFRPSDFGPRSSTDAQARASAREAASVAEGMKGEVERLLLLSQALWEILREKHGLTDDELVKKIAEIDLRDGRLDGRLAPSASGGVKECPECGRPLGKKRPVCIYCGTAVVVDPFER